MSPQAPIIDAPAPEARSEARIEPDPAREVSSKLGNGDAAPTYIAEALRPLAVPIVSLALDPRNARMHGPENISAIQRSLSRWGQRLPIVVQRQGRIVRAGNGRLIAARNLGWTMIAAIIVDESDVEAAAYGLADNQTAALAEWDHDALADLLSELRRDDTEAFLATGFSQADLDALINELSGPAEAADRPGLADRFGAPPFSVLDARQGYWQDRKRQWLSLGIKSEIGRGGLEHGSTPPHGPRVTQKADGTLNYEPPQGRKRVQKRESKMAMDNDPMQRKNAYSASPGGSPMPAANYGKNRKRGDGHGRPIG